VPSTKLPLPVELEFMFMSKSSRFIVEFKSFGKQILFELVLFVFVFVLLLLLLLLLLFRAKLVIEFKRFKLNGILARKMFCKLFG